MEPESAVKAALVAPLGSWIFLSLPFVAWTFSKSHSTSTADTRLLGHFPFSKFTISFQFQVLWCRNHWKWPEGDEKRGKIVSFRASFPFEHRFLSSIDVGWPFSLRFNVAFWSANCDQINNHRRKFIGPLHEDISACLRGDSSFLPASRAPLLWPFEDDVSCSYSRQLFTTAQPGRICDVFLLGFLLWCADLLDTVRMVATFHSNILICTLCGFSSDFTVLFQ